LPARAPAGPSPADALRAASPSASYRSALLDPHQRAATPMSWIPCGSGWLDRQGRQAPGDRSACIMLGEERWPGAIDCVS
jgi:hypothetical protein